MRLPRGLVLPLAGSAMAIAVSLADYFEGFTLTAYQDSGGVWTICNGSTQGVTPDLVETPEGCKARKAKDLAEAREAVRRLVRVPMPATREAAFIDFAYNAGPGNLAKSSMVSQINRGNTAAACAAFDRWVYVAGKNCNDPAAQCRGIVTRRGVERWLCEVGQ